jgi:TNF receptor-associated protein 1
VECCHTFAHETFLSISWVFCMRKDPVVVSFPCWLPSFPMMISRRCVVTSRRVALRRKSYGSFQSSVARTQSSLVANGWNASVVNSSAQEKPFVHSFNRQHIAPSQSVLRYLSTAAEKDSDDDDKSKKSNEPVDAEIVGADTGEGDPVAAEVMDAHKSEPTEAELVTDENSNGKEEGKGDSVSTEPPKLESLPAGEKMEFQAETRQLLDIVTNSLYTDKEVFLRELVSNASDSLEKLRHLQATNQVPDGAGDTPLEIRITLDEVTSSISIVDTGIGMTKEELISNLGVIARSGSKNFVKELKEGGDTSKGSIIGKFGVGFYSAFMVGRKVEVRSKSAMKPDEPPRLWVSDGSGSYEISDLPDGFRQDRGSSIIIYLKEDDWGFVEEKKIEGILKKYSNFVNFPIYLNGKIVNTVKALWSQDPKEITHEEYVEFYKYVANSTEEPMETYHFRADAPIDIKALLFIPTSHGEKTGMDRLLPGVSLYSRKILIEPRSPNILPDWLRFIKGVVDSEDLPLSISREKPQDTALVTKLRKTLTRKVITHISRMALKEKDKFQNEFYKEYSYFLKEGICQDSEAQHHLSKLLRYESSRVQSKDVVGAELVSFDDYISRMRPEQSDIYFLLAPNRKAALNSPYLEAFENADVEVLLMYTSIDEFVMANMQKYENKNLISADKGNIDFNHMKKKTDDADEEKEKKDAKSESIYKADRELTKEEQLEFCAWYRKTLESKLASISCTNRLTTSPAIVTDTQSIAMRRMMKMMDTGDGKEDVAPLGKQQVQINPKHPAIVGLYDIIKTQPALAKVLAEQIFDNALVAAGLLDDSRAMIPRINDILVCLVNGERERSKLEKSVGGSSSFVHSSVPDSAETVKDTSIKGEVEGAPVDEESSVAPHEDVLEADFSETGTVSEGKAAEKN